jgi:hypothetical protein
MNPGGVLLVVIGVWVVAQVLAGDALGRLNLTGGTPTPSSSSSQPVPRTSSTTPATGTGPQAVSA